MRAIHPWIFRPRPNPAPHLRLFCVPYAGRGASLYRDWPEHVNSQVELCALQLPGRENRLREPPFTRIADAVQEAAQVLQSYLDVPFALFGHSMGGLICFELARRLRSLYEIAPVHLFISARRAPQLPDPRPPLCPLQDEQFVAEIRRRYNGIPREVLGDPELMELLLPMLRADVEMLETYTYAPGPNLECPITAFGGWEDTEARFEELAAWCEQTNARFQTKMFPGDHFFLQSAQTQILETISQQLNLEVDLTPGASSR
ncbi:MAG: alpha/beta fold hydrolase [Acidobacteriia bacterium]|nr:alpha/beta fold hydrolase [Terriglobia bacterium]